MQAWNFKTYTVDYDGTSFNVHHKEKQHRITTKDEQELNYFMKRFNGGTGVNGAVSDDGLVLYID
ncbi:hypothetical protein [Paraliobacillus salinarum]|uniref:hypothetical protein n=1 Tax=Paraliobacillus salinarum TaxID=1158996 RepID=UPI0015F56A4A|nr:hypothetical protein [Paraliobacillus salinarum]